MKPEDVAFCTVVAKNYLAHARVLVESVRRHHPNSRCYVLLVDAAEGWFEPQKEAFQMIRLADLELPHPREFCFRYDVVELSTAVRPFLLRHLFERGHEGLIYLDPDIRVYRPLDGILEEMDRWDVLLTPHLTAPLEPDQHPGERHILLRGTYNMGFLALRRRPHTDQFLRWLSDRLERECLVEPEQGLFVDQRWMDLAPGMVAGLRVLRDPGYNVGHWNVRQRPLSGTPSAPTAGDRPLVFFHFSGFEPECPGRLSRYDQSEVAAQPLRSLLAEYGDDLKAAGYAACAQWPYSHGVFADGYPITPQMRAIFRELPAGRFPDPFTTDGEESFLRWAVSEVGRRSPPEKSAARAASERDAVRPEDLPPIVQRILAARDDVRRAYQTPNGRLDRPGLIAWLANDGVRHYQLRPEWCDEWGGRPRAPGVMPRLLAFYDARADLQKQFPMAFVAEHDAPAFLDWIESHARKVGLSVEELESTRRLFAAGVVARIREICAKRPDVMKAYPAALGWPADPGFVGWLQHWGSREHGVPTDWALWFARAQDQHACLRVHQAYEQHRDWQESHPHGLSPLGRARLLDSLKRSASSELGRHPERVRHLCPPGMRSPIEELRRLLVEDPALHERFPGALQQIRQTEGLLEWLRQQAAAGVIESGWLTQLEGELRPLGLLGHGTTVVGYLRAGFGLGELARATVRALEAVDYPCAATTVEHQAAWQGDFSDRLAPAPYPFSIVHLNPDGVRSVRDRPDLKTLPGCYRIGYWAWELEAVPPDWMDGFSLFDEVWTCSRHAAAALAGTASAPVQTMWPAMEPMVEPMVSEAESHPPARDGDEYTFLFIYDLLSETARKNPTGLIEAFRRAFRDDDRVRLVIKTANGHLRREEFGAVMNAARGLRVSLRDGYYSRAQILALIRGCDCYVSLHRAEGFGLTLAEAMALGKPVIATYYSGNVDFMTPWNSFPVPYSLAEVSRSCGPYMKGAVWAEPDLEVAAHLLRGVYERRGAAAEVAARGQSDVRRLLSPHACGQRMAERFRAIRKNGLVELG